MLDVAAYLERIAFNGPVTPNAETLRRLHRAHLCTVPFENLDIFWKRELRLDKEAFVHKIVNRRRGGFCYELNGAFAALLEALGFSVTFLSARVKRPDGGYGPEFDHLALRVDLDEPWLVDVGFGDCFVDPIRLKTGITQEQSWLRFRIVNMEHTLGLQRKGTTEARWKTQYLLNPKPRRMEEFAQMCCYHQTSPQSPFVGRRACTLARPDGRVTLADMKLIMVRNCIREERLLQSDGEWWSVLADYFGIHSRQTIE